MLTYAEYLAQNKLSDNPTSKILYETYKRRATPNASTFADQIKTQVAAPVVALKEAVPEAVQVAKPVSAVEPMDLGELDRYYSGQSQADPAKFRTEAINNRITWASNPANRPAFEKELLDLQNANALMGDEARANDPAAAKSLSDKLGVLNAAALKMPAYKPDMTRVADQFGAQPTAGNVIGAAPMGVSGAPPVAASKTGAISGEIKRDAQEQIGQIADSPALKKFVQSGGESRELKKPEDKDFWSKVGQVAKDTGLGILGVLQAAMTASSSAQLGKSFDFKNDTLIGQTAAKKDRLAEIEQARKEQTEDFDKGKSFQLQLKQIDQDFATQQAGLQREFEQKMKEAQTAEQKAAVQAEYRQREREIGLSGAQRLAEIQAQKKPEAGAATADRLGIR
jgi:hypothetical protein